MLWVYQILVHHEHFSGWSKSHSPLCPPSYAFPCPSRTMIVFRGSASTLLYTLTKIRPYFSNPRHSNFIRPSGDFCRSSVNRALAILACFISSSRLGLDRGGFISGESYPIQRQRYLMGSPRKTNTAENVSPSYILQAFASKVSPLKEKYLTSSVFMRARIEHGNDGTLEIEATGLTIWLELLFDLEVQLNNEKNMIAYCGLIHIQ